MCIRDRLQIAALDLRDPRQVLAFTDHMLSQGLPLDVLINNAAQTLRRSPQAYSALSAAETGGTTPTPASLTAPQVWTAPGFSVPGPRTTPLPWTAELAPRLHAPHAPHAPHALAGTPHSADVSAAAGDRRRGGPAARDNRNQLLDAASGTDRPDRAAGSPAGQCRRPVPARRPPAPSSRRLPAPRPLPHQRLRGRRPVHRAQQDQRSSAHQHGQSGAEHAHPHQRRRPGRPRHPHLQRRDIVDGAARIYHPIVQGQAGAPLHGILLKDYRQVPW